MNILEELPSKPSKKIDLKRTEADWAETMKEARKVKDYHGVYPVVLGMKRKKKV